MTEDGTAADDNPGAPHEQDDTTEPVRTSIDPNPETAEYDLLELVAKLEETDIEALPPLYTQVDHFVESLFKEPPTLESQMQLQFSYAGYRITLTQRGDVTLLNVKQTLAE